MATSPAPDPAAPRPALPVWAKRLLLVALGLAPLALAEAGLRLAGFGGKAPLLNPLFPGEGMYEIHPRAAEVFFAKSTPGGALMVGSHRRDLVTLPKPPGTVRVVFAGASTVEGFPFPRNLTSARFLEEMLRHAMPGRRVEVINLGVTAVASFPIRELAVEALAELDPDLLLLYEAHNELYGAGGVASFQFMGRSVRAMEATYALRRMALVQVADALAGTARAAPGQGGREQMIQVMAGVGRIEPGGALHEAARASLTGNFRAVVRAARSRGVPVVLATVASNERDLAPVASWEEGPRERRAAAVYSRARTAEGAGKLREAAELYRRARDLDAMPWRAARDKNRALRELAMEEGVPLADCEAAFARASAATGGATTWALFADHVHPSLEGQALLARTFLDALAAHRLLPVEPARLASLPDWRETAARLGAHPLELFLLAHKMATLFRVPPLGTHNAEAARRAEAVVERFRRQADPVDAEAIRRWEQASAAAGFALPISFFGGAAALRAGDLPRAGVYLRAAIENAFPWSDERSAARLLAVLGEGLAGEREAARRDLAATLAEAERVATLPGQPSALLARTLAGLFTLAGRAADADRVEALAQERAAAAPAWEQAFLAELPAPAQLRPLVAAPAGG